MDGNTPAPSPNLFVFDVERDLYARTPLYREATAWWNDNYAQDVYRRGVAGELRQLRRAGRRPQRQTDGDRRRHWWEQNRRDWCFFRRVGHAVSAFSRDERIWAHLSVRDAGRILLITVLVTRPDVDFAQLKLREDTPWRDDPTGRRGFGRSWAFEQWDYGDGSGVKGMWMRLAAAAWELMRRQPDPAPAVAHTPNPPPQQALPPSAATPALEPAIYAEDGTRRHTPEQQALFRQAVAALRARPTDFIAAGRWVDEFGQPSVEGAKLRSAYDTVFAAAEVVRTDRPHYEVLNDAAAAEWARRVLLVACVLSDPNDLSDIRPRVTRLQDWAWGETHLDFLILEPNAPPPPASTSPPLNRFFARHAILDLDLALWCDRVREALGVLARVAPTGPTQTADIAVTSNTLSRAASPPATEPDLPMLTPGEQVLALGLRDGDGVRNLQIALGVRKWAKRIGLPLLTRKVGTRTDVRVDQFAVIAALWKEIRSRAASDNEAAKTLSGMRQIATCNECYNVFFPKEKPVLCACGSRNVQLRDMTPRRRGRGGAGDAGAAK